MIKDVLTEMKKHMRYYLHPLPQTYPDRAKEMDFNTAVHLFESHLSAAWFEMEENGEDFSKEVEERYAQKVIKYISEGREQVNQFFRHDTPEEREYNYNLQQMEAEGVAEDPMPPAYNPEGYSPIELALYLNKVCLWWQRQFNAHVPCHEGAEIKPVELESINAKLLVLKQTKIYDFILEAVCKNDKTRAAKLIAVITGEKIGSVRVAAAYLATSHIPAKGSPYTNPAMQNALACLAELSIDRKDLEEIYSKKNSRKK